MLLLFTPKSCFFYFLQFVSRFGAVNWSVQKCHIVSKLTHLIKCSCGVVLLFPGASFLCFVAVQSGVESIYSFTFLARIFCSPVSSPYLPGGFSCVPSFVF